MLLIAIPLCLNAQVNPTKPENPQSQNPSQEELDRIQKEKEQAEKTLNPAKPAPKTHTPVVKPKNPAPKPEKPVANPEKPGTNPEKPAPKPEKPMAPEKPGDPRSGIEMPKISGFVQGLYQANIDNEGDLVSNTFRMRRVRLSVDGNLGPKVSYKLQGDFSRSPMLVDAYLKYKPCNEFAIQVGQFKTPFTIESPINPVNLEIFDYGEIIQKLGGYSDVCGVGGLGRDIGVMATGSLFPIKKEGKTLYSVVDYSLGVFNGNGPTALDNNNRKDIVGRLEVHPGLKALTLSGSYYYGKYYKDEDFNGTRNRWAAGAQYNDGKLVLRGEYISGTTGWMEYSYNDHLGLSVDVIENFYYSNGYYALAGYNFSFGKDKSQKLMPVLRYEHFTADQAVANGGTNWYTAGINYWPMKSVNFKLDYSLVQKESGTNSHRVVGILSYKF